MNNSVLKGKVLVLYYHNLGYPLRETNKDMLYCFRQFSDKYVYYVNVAFTIPAWITNISYDLIIFHDLLLCKRSLPRRFMQFVGRAGILKKLKGYKIAIVQDEFTQTDILNEFLHDFGVQHVFSCAEPAEWPKIYPLLINSKVKFNTVLTGYINDKKLEVIDSIAKNVNKRSIDIGYRANYSQRYSLGSHGLLKGRIADVFREKAGNTDLHLDVSTNPEDSILGNDWYRFLLKSKYTLGVESGASLLDHDGEIERKVKKYLISHPGAAYNDVEENCFKGVDGNLKLFATGPRHFEAVMTRTCQILIEGDYNGIFKPWVHYIPLRRDFSNIDEVLILIKEDSKRSEIVEKAYSDIVLSANYTYRAFISTIFKQSLGENYKWSEAGEDDKNYYNKSLERENLLWKIIPVRTFIINFIFRLMPKRFFSMVENFMLKNVSKNKSKDA